MMNNYTDLLAIAEAEAESAGVDVNTALKEILHYDILFALSESQIGERLVFQGGTSLRLCHQGNRYSEDLDFVAGKPDTAEHMEAFKTILTRTINERYGLEVRFKDPKPVRFSDSLITVQRWTAIVHVPRDNICLPQNHKIKIEVCNVPSRNNEAMFVQRHYDGLAPGYDHILLRTSTLREIIADKILAAANRPSLKPRDIWDLNWLSRKQVPIDLTMVASKLKDYRETEVFENNLERRIELLHGTQFVETFNQEMGRFLNSRMRDALKRSPDFTPKLLRSVARDLERVHEARRQNVPLLNFEEMTL